MSSTKVSPQGGAKGGGACLPMMCIALLVMLSIGLSAAVLASTIRDTDTITDSLDAHTATITDSLRIQEPPLVGIMPGKDRPKIILGQDVDWPPYAYIAEPPEGDFAVAGFGNDMANGLKEVCDIDIVTLQTQWDKCWGSNMIGDGIASGEFHGCMTYTHTHGSRPRYLEYSYGILQANKPAGLLVLLGSDGKPAIDPTTTDLTGKKIVDVSGWAPTADGMALVTNKCTGNPYTGMTIITPETSGNDAAMKMLQNGQADGMWLYADQAYNYRPDQAGVIPTWSTALWDGWGTKFAYIATGMFGHAINGTTLTISKKGSGLSNIINPCLKKYMETESYHTVCTKHGLESSCYPNNFFTTADAGPKPYEKPTNEQTGDCSDGYCACDVGVTVGQAAITKPSPPPPSPPSLPPPLPPPPSPPPPTSSPATVIFGPTGNACPSGYVKVDSLEACKAAMHIVGQDGDTFKGEDGSDQDWPAGCYFCPSGMSGCSRGTWFNEHPTGSANGDTKPYCSKNFVPLVAGRTIFIGDSDIDYWTSTPDDFLGSYNLGVGGFTCRDVLNEVDSTLAAIRPAWVVLVCGENDIAGGTSTIKTFDRFQEIVQKILAIGARVLYVGTKPEPDTSGLHEKYQAYDALIEQYAGVLATKAGGSPPPIVMVDSYKGFEALGNPTSLYDNDGLHLSSEGYGHYVSWVQQGISSSSGCQVWLSGQCAQG